ncbi:peptidylprolyl isomerase [Lujinxingia vulgaris]|uniref:Peptidyl-prolyl cis-trans isomerase n=2 Tax=Lujinxingia vulgaris TaxID=2600176 RepID=A0A5C6XDQ0_9DELT|nr:peptidylprolyl isomerase [Lujinxingia vulgaris]
MIRTLLALLIALNLAVGCDSPPEPRVDSTPAESEAASAEEAAEETAEEATEEATEASDDQPAADTNAQAGASGDLAANNAALLHPDAANEEAPETFKINFGTTKGDFVVEVTREWAPRGADRLYNLVKIGYYDNIAFFRVIDGFMAQFGIHGDPRVNQIWRDARISDDEVKQSNERGYVSFATAGPNTRTTQLFINFGNNAQLDSMGFAPVGRVVEGMDIVDSLYKGYGEGAPRGRGPDQGRLQAQGNAYLKAEFPELDYTTEVRIVE